MEAFLKKHHISVDEEQYFTFKRWMVGQGLVCLYKSKMVSQIKDMCTEFVLEAESLYVCKLNGVPIRTCALSLY